MSIISFINRNFFDINIIENRYLRNEMISILEELFEGFTFEKKSFKMDEYKKNMIVYNVEKIDTETIRRIIKRQCEDCIEKVVDETKESKGIYGTKGEIEYVIRYVYDKKKNIHSICCNVENGVGVLHRYFGDSFRIDYDATCETIEFKKEYIDDDDVFITERNRYIKSNNGNIILMSEIKKYDSFKLYYVEGKEPEYTEKFDDIYHDGKFGLESKIEPISNMLYLTDRTSMLPSELTKGTIVCNGLVAYDRTNNAFSYDGIITCYDSYNPDTSSLYKNMPLYSKLKKLLKNYELRKQVDDRVKKYIKKDS